MGVEVQLYYLFKLNAIIGVVDQRHVQAALPPVKTEYPFYRRLGGPQGL